MPVAMPELAATASASSTTSSRVSTRSPSVSIPTLHFTLYPLPSPSRASAPIPVPRPGLVPLLGRKCAEKAGGTAASVHKRDPSPPLAQLRQQGREFFQAAEVMAGQDQVDVLGGDHHPQRARPEVRVVALVRVHPDQRV